MEWTTERIAAFWEHLSRSAAAEGEYFTFQVGAGVVTFLAQAVPLRGARVLDFGCGPGFLIEHLLRAGAKVTGADASPHSVRLATERYGGKQGWDGAFEIRNGRAPFADQTFDGVCCIETVEHVPKEFLGGLVAEIARVLAPGGWVLFTTPNEENLSRSMVLCPACGEEFHKVQHLSSWTADSLSSLLSSGGLDVRFCRAVDLGRFQEPPRRPARHWSAAYLYRRAERAGVRLADRLSPRPFPEGRFFGLYGGTGPHLVAVATKPAPR
jgi:2-polyprenyl-3-methyl-5-hydroxy-6-metoxy-1,4-benzoquinol methylase